MSSLSDWLRQSRALRVVAMVLTFLLPVTNILSAAVVVMTARSGGPRLALPEVMVALAVVAGLAMALGGSPLPPVLGAVALWSGSIVAGMILRRFGSVDLAVQALVLLAMAGVIATLVLGPDPRSYWQPVLEELLKQAGLPEGSGPPAGWLGTIAVLMPGVIAASVLSTLLLALILSVWLDRDEGGPSWRRLFLSLRIGRVLSLSLVPALGLMLAGQPGAGGGLLLVLATAFMAQGISVIHWLADRRGWPGIWPLVLYGPLLLGPPVAGLIMLALVAIGLADNGYPLRRPGPDVV